MAANEYARRTVLKETVFSQALGKERSLRVFLPPGYNELVSHRVVYCQDGEECFNFGRIATHATRLILDEGFEPFLVVGVDVDMPNRTDEYAPDGSRFGAYSRFFLEELIPFVESRYPVRTGAGDRVLVGDSLGGTVSLHLSLQVPHSIQRVVALSGAFLDSSLSAIESAGAEELSWLRLYQLIGTEETAVATSRGTFDFLEANRRMRTLLEAKGADVRYVEKAGKHIWGFWQDELPEALRWALGE
ncbi:esterase family protein [Paenibacillus antri]|uniref:Esterase family protein n=1 Tax=Paenibacillus antri TaxID=2582848 RepID=A0A5R9GIW5_9BACL|nr:alpha/beta hydrolase-fold protein [Paenibacillus antri]TLS54280.1 esterase family protein [Paenibacillus antri]